MVNTFISPVIGKASELGVSSYEDSNLIELRPNDSSETIETVVHAVYRQVLGNAYVMDSERLTVPESKLKQGSISVREFVRQVAQSELYQSRFFDTCPRYRSIELNFKHLLGRAPDSYAETSAHSKILDEGGYIAEIDSYIDSDEYQNKFGENIVPYYCGYKTQTGKNIVGFTHLFSLLRGASSSDKKLTTQDSPRILSSIINNSPSVIVPPSDTNSYGGVTDINKLLTNVLKKKEAVISAPQTPKVKQFLSYSASSSKSYSNLDEQYQEQEKQIEQLQQKLSSLSSFASIGNATIGQWQSSDTSGSNSEQYTFGNTSNPSTSTGLLDINRQVEAQKQTICELEQKITDAERLANIGAARLNKWRNRSFF